MTQNIKQDLKYCRNINTVSLSQKIIYSKLINNYFYDYLS